MLDHPRSHRQTAFIIAVGFLPVLAGFIIDDYVSPALVWGGNVCGDGASSTSQCQIPPYMMAVAIALSALLAEQYLEKSVAEEQ